MFTIEDGVVSFYIDLKDKNYTVAGAKVTGVGMVEEGDLAVYWDTAGLVNTGGGDMGMLLMRGDDDEVGAVMGEFYWNDGFTDTLKQIILDAGFSEEAADDICTSEWGMQDEGRASYDAYALSEEIAAKAEV